TRTSTTSMASPRSAHTCSTRPCHFTPVEPPLMWFRWRETRAGVTSAAVPHYLLATDADWIVEQVHAALDGPEVGWTLCRSGREVRGAVAALAAAGSPPALAVLDLQIGTMGGVAVCLDLRLEESAGRLPHVPVLMLLDRSADVFLAQR